MFLDPKTKQKRLVKRVLIAIALLGSAMLILHWLKSPPSEPPHFAMPVEMVTVAPQPLEVTLESVGTLVANESVVLRPEIAGRVTGIFFTEGEAVSQGAKLFQIDDRVSQAQLKQAAANLQLARVNYARFAKLAKTGAATKQRFEEAQANLGVAQANHDLAQAQVAYATITAPFDGTVGLRKVSPGDYVNAGQTLANFVSYDPMKVDFSVPETEASKLQIGQSLAIGIEALPDRSFTGTVYAIDPQVDVAGRSLSLRATIPNPDNALRPGYFAHVELTVGHKDAALLIPEAAIVPQGDQKFVYLVATDGTPTLTPVTLGMRRAGEVEILTGLAAGDRVVTSGQMKIRPGTKVTDAAQMQAPASASQTQQETPPPASEKSAPEDTVAAQQKSAEPAPSPSPLPDVSALDASSASEPKSTDISEDARQNYDDSTPASSPTETSLKDDAATQQKSDPLDATSKGE